jgi:hypothetical protein
MSDADRAQLLQVLEQARVIVDRLAADRELGPQELINLHTLLHRAQRIINPAPGAG